MDVQFDSQVAHAVFHGLQWCIIEAFLEMMGL